MALNKKVYDVKTPISALIFSVHGVFDHHPKSRKPVAAQSEIGNLAGLQLKLELVCDKSDKFGIRGFSLGITDSIAEKSLECVQIATIPSYFNSVTDGTLHSGRGGLECLGDLRVQYLGDGVGVPYGPPGGLAGCS